MDKQPALKSSFVKQAAILAAATLSARFIGFLYRIPLTYFIGDEGNALYGIGFQFYLFLLVLSSAGLPSAVSKMVSERIARGQYANAHVVFRAAMIVAVSFGTAGSILLWVMAGHFSVWLMNPGSAYAIRAVAPAILLVAIMAVFRGYFQGMNNTIPTALSQVIEQFFNAVFKIWLAFIFIDSLEFAAAGATAATAIGAFIGLLTLLGIYKLLSPKIHARIRHDINSYKRAYPIERPSKLIKPVLFTAFPIILGTAVYSIANFIDMAMVPHRLAASGAFTQEEATSLLGQLTGKFIVLTTLPVSISTALSIAVLPSIAGSTVTNDNDAVLGKIGRALRLSMLISIPSAVGISVLAGPILLLLFPSHPDGALLLQVGGVSIIFLSIVQVATGALQGIGKIMIPVLGAATGAIAKIPLNYFLIYQPQINVVGAVISTIVCYFLASAVNLSALKIYTGLKIDWISLFIKPLFAAGVMGGVCMISYHIMMYIRLGNTISTIFSVGVGVMVYFVFLILLKGLHAEDISRLPLVKRLV